MVQAVAAEPPKEKTWADVSIQRVPKDVAESLSSAALSRDDCLICVSTPLLLDGSFGESWFAIGPKKVAVVARDNGSVKVTWSSAIESLKAARTQKVTGGGMLVITVDGRAEEVLRFDAGHAGLFGEIANCLHKHVAPPEKKKKKKDDEEQEETKEEKEPEAKADEEEEPKKPEPLEFGPLLTKQRELICTKCERRYPKNTKVCPFCVERGSTLKRILTFAIPYKKQLITMGSLMVVGMLLQLAPPQIFRILVDEVLVDQSQAGRVLPLVGLMGLILVLSHVVTVFRSRLGVHTGCAITNSIQKTVFRHLQALSLSYFNKQQTGALMARVNNDTRQMQGFLVDGIQFTIINMLIVVGVSAILIWMNPVLGVLVLVPAPFVIIVSKWAWHRIIRRFRLLWSAMSAVSSYLNDALSGVRVIKAFGQEPVEITRYDGKVDYARDQMIAAERTWQTLVPFLNFLVQSSMLLVWYFGSFQVYADRLTLGELLAYISYLGMVFGPLQLLTRLNDWLSRSLTAAARVFEVLDAEPDVKNRPEAKPMPEMTWKIELSDVVFGYEKHNPVIKNLNLTIEPGTMIGLVGHSGAGKSTLINLMGRLYDIDEGEIKIDGVDVRDIKLEDLRSHIGYVLQDTFLFNGTVAENIAYARPEATREDIINAAVTANAHKFIMNLPDGYDTVVGERGAKLSGGERQRVAIARAVLHDPKILILDEATASVDTETESKIQMALGKLVKGRTTIAIAHRLSTLRHANRLVVVDKGKVKEEGTHAELMAKKDGVYKKLVDIQTEWSQTIAVGG